MKTRWRQFTQSVFFVKLLSWEYWPVYITNIPVVLFWLYFAARSRSLFFFSAVNPVIETGGVMGESKINIFHRIPAHTLPKTIFIKKENIKLSFVLDQIQLAGINFPLIAKPNVGERGFLVEKIKDEKALSDYLNKVAVDFLIQELVTYPLELSVLYYRLPYASGGKITSICVKKNLSVLGDGVSTIAELMQAYPRARLQLARFKKQYPGLLKKIPSQNELVELEPIGNHCRGTTFLNGNQHIDAQMESVFDEIGFQMDGIYYGRFDLKCASFELLKKGQSFKVLEFNGIASEPAHIYDPEYPVRKAYSDLYRHWKIIYEISKQQRSKGIASMSLKEAYTSLRDYFRYLRTAQQANLS